MNNSRVDADRQKDGKLTENPPLMRGRSLIKDDKDRLAKIFEPKRLAKLTI